MKTPHFAIVGAGIVGAALAHRLAKSGARVTILDAGLPASAASGASFGWLNASFFSTPAHHHLRAASLEAYHSLETELETGALWQGTLWWEENGAALTALAGRLTQFGYPVQTIARAAFQSMASAIGDPPDEALFFPSEGAVDAASLTLALLAAAARHGAHVWSGCAATGLRGTPSCVSGVATALGPLAADGVILAAGCATAALLAPLGLTLPMLQRPGLLLQTQPVAPLIHHILVAPGQEVRQSRQGHLIAPTAANHQSDASGTIDALPGDLAEVTLARLRALLPGANLQLERITCAFRPVPRDGLPAVGPAGPDGLYIATMHSGVTLAPLIGNLVAAELLTGQAAPLLLPFRPSRFF